MKICSKLLFKPLCLVMCIFMLISALSLSVFAAEKCPEVSGSNVGDHQYIHNWSSVIRSHLVMTKSGDLMRFQAGAVDGQYLVEYYNTSYSLKKVTYIKEELPIFGGFYASDKYYFILSGQNNPNESPYVECFRITKYDHSWKRIASAGLTDCNTCIPFDAGSARFAEYGKYLVIRTSHEMYQDDFGINHQSNVTIQLDMEKMVISDSQTKVAHIDAGYMSHSFNQFVHIENGKIVALDHGDAHLRAITLIKFPTDISTEKFNTWDCESIEAVPIPGNYGDNHTGIEVGGFEISESQYIIAYSAVVLDDDFHKYNTKNVFITTVDKKTNRITTRRFTNFKEGEEGASDPHLVKINNKEFMLIWSVGNDVYCTKTNENGVATDSIHRFENEFLSDCPPIVVNNKLVWFIYKDELVTFYEIDLIDYSVKETEIFSGHHMEMVSAPNAPGEFCTIKCEKCNHKETFKTGTSLSLYWNTNKGEGSYIMPLKQTSFKTGDRLYVMLIDETETPHNEKVIDYPKDCMDYTEMSSSHGYFVFTKPGTYSLTISYKFNPLVKEKFTFTVSGDELYTDIPSNTEEPKTDIDANPDGIGDINLNGKIDMTDYILLKRAYFGTYSFNSDQNQRGDINKNQKIDMTDYILLKRVYFGTYTI